MPETYIVFTFAPVQGFIEKSRKLRDLYGSSRILSHLSNQVVKQVGSDRVISPALLRVQPERDRERSGIPNRILLKVNFSDPEQIDTMQKTIEETFLAEWKRVLTHCQNWVQTALESYYQHWGWDEEWNHWANHTWELFFGVGTTIPEAIHDLENCKLRRNWTAINWIGESSSLTGTDAIAFPGLGGEKRNPKILNWGEEKREIETFYRYLAFLLDNPQYRQRDLRQISPKIQPEGRYVAANEKLSIPELTKRLVTYRDISQSLGMPDLERFTELVRRAQDNPKGEGQWTGWFMGDGDKVGDYLEHLAKKPDCDRAIKAFSQAMRDWGNRFYTNFPEDLGRVIYAGGDDFLGIIYNKDFPETSQNINTLEILQWLMQLPQEWEQEKSDEINREVTLSLGFVWAAPAVPQRDILQHCREAEKRSKTQGRKRVTLRIVFSNGQYVQWTTPWQSLSLLTQYQDREGIQYKNGNLNQYQDRTGKAALNPPNWSHIYTDLAQLKARRAIDLSLNPKKQADLIDPAIALKLFDLYFPEQADDLNDRREDYTGSTEDFNLIQWINDSINVGWQLCDKFRPKPSPNSSQ